MTRTFLTEVKGFTPIIDVIVQSVGLMPALVYGVVWRYCQMKNGECSASLDTMGQMVGVKRDTVRRHIEILCKSGYLEDTTPRRCNRPHVYRDTGKAKIMGLVGAVSTIAESNTDEVGIAESNTRYSRKQHPGIAESNVNIEDRKEDTHGNSGKAKSNPSRNMFGALADLCQIDWHVCDAKLRGELNQTEKILRTKASVKVEELPIFGEWWRMNDWRGKLGQSPTPTQVRNTWGQFKASQMKRTISL